MKRVVVTGLGVLSPNAVEVDNFVEALKSGKSGIQYIEELERLNFGCKVGGIPPLTDDIKNKYFNELQQKMLQRIRQKPLAEAQRKGFCLIYYFLFNLPPHRPPAFLQHDDLNYF